MARGLFAAPTNLWIWAVIYTSFVSCMVQIGGGASQSADAVVDTMLLEQRVEHGDAVAADFRSRACANLGAASVVLIVVTVMACLAIVSERAWRERSTVAILLTAPISLLAGWLMVASALNVALHGRRPRPTRPTPSTAAPRRPT